MEMELDRISNLPDNIIDHILSFLHVLDAARTCILSSKWRYRWAMLPYLDLVSLADDLSLERSMVDTKLEITIDQVLLLHFGPLHKFQLYEINFLDDSAMDRWILFLTKGSNSINEISLRNYRHIGQYYRMPSCSCQSLINLDLAYCSLKPPSSFKGFSKLKSLNFFSVNMSQDVLENLVSSCPMLETLKLFDVRVSHLEAFSHLNINVPSLRFFTCLGNFEGISFQNTLFLGEVTIEPFNSITYNPNRACSSSNLLEFVHLPRIQKLAINNNILKYLSVGVKHGELLNPCVYLNYLKIEINLNNWEESLAALCLLSIAPNLQELHIVVDHLLEEEIVSRKETNFWEDDRGNCQTFTKLQLVKIIEVSSTKPEFDFIKFILLNSPVLERIEVIPDDEDIELELLKKLLPLRRASVKAQIICLDH